MASIISEYIAKRMSVLDLKKELSRLRSENNKLTERNLFIYAADFNKSKQGIDVSLMEDDFYMIQDILRESDKKQIDIYLETPGGSGGAAEEIARFLHSKFEEVNFVIAGEVLDTGEIQRKYFEENRYLSSSFVDFGYDWEIHPAFRWALQPEDIDDIFNKLEL